jgi:hypothetical protein
LAFSEHTASGCIPTERGFRDYWKQSDKNGNERQRFREIQCRLIESEAGKSTNTNLLNTTIREDFSDGKWHKGNGIARWVEATSSACRPLPQSAATGAAKSSLRCRSMIA